MDQIEQERQMAALRNALIDCKAAVNEGGGAVLILVSEHRIRVEAFNCSEEELHSVLAAAHSMVTEGEAAEGDTLQ